jgi:hypothetical protein
MPQRCWKRDSIVLNLQQAWGWSPSLAAVYPKVGRLMSVIVILF